MFTSSSEPTQRGLHVQKDWDNMIYNTCINGSVLYMSICKIKIFFFYILTVLNATRKETQQEILSGTWRRWFVYRDYCI